MAIRTTKWRPDTCSKPECVINYTWDDAVADDSRVHTVSSVDNKCTLHAALTDDLLWLAVTAQNPLKNRFLERLATLEPSMFDPANGTALGGRVTWQFNASGVLEVTLTGVTQGRKNQIQANVDAQFGAGKVIIL